MKRLTVLFLTMLLLSINAFSSDKLIDYIGVKGPLQFNDTNFYLSWTNTQSGYFFFQEYIPKNETLDKYNQMMLIQVTVKDYPLENFLAQFLNMLDKRKETDKVCNYNIISSPDKSEYIVDFLMSEGDSKTIHTAEFNVYKYSKITLGTNKSAIILYGYSSRVYGDEITPFLQALKNERTAPINEMISAKIPSVKISH